MSKQRGEIAIPITDPELARSEGKLWGPHPRARPPDQAELRLLSS